jgi:hypothetical protein
MTEPDDNSEFNKKINIIDNRKYPRIETAGNVTLVLNNNKLLITSLFDISQDGVQVRFDNDTALSLKPVIDSISDNLIEEIEVRFTLSILGQKEQIITNCKPIYIMKVDKGLFAMGMQFSGINKTYTGYVQQFIEDSMEPKE